MSVPIFNVCGLTLILGDLIYQVGSTVAVDMLYVLREPSLNIPQDEYSFALSHPISLVPSYLVNLCHFLHIPVGLVVPQEPVTNMMSLMEGNNKFFLMNGGGTSAFFLYV